MPFIVALGLLLWLSAQSSWNHRGDAQRRAEADARTLAIELMVAAHRQSQLAVEASACGPASCGIEVTPTGSIEPVVPGQVRLVNGVRVIVEGDGSVSTELMRPGFRYEGYALDARRVGAALWTVSGGDPRLGVIEGSTSVGPGGTRPVGGAMTFTQGSVVGQSR